MRSKVLAKILNNTSQAVVDKVRMETKMFLQSIMKSKRTSFYCQREIEGNKACKEQCAHCEEYYAPLEDDED